MFVPLPVPLVLQRAAPDLWRLKAPLPLRSTHGKSLSLHTLTDMHDGKFGGKNITSTWKIHELILFSATRNHLSRARLLFP